MFPIRRFFRYFSGFPSVFLCNKDMIQAVIQSIFVPCTELLSVPIFISSDSSISCPVRVQVFLPTPIQLVFTQNRFGVLFRVFPHYLGLMTLLFSFSSFPLWNVIFFAKMSAISLQKRAEMGKKRERNFFSREIRGQRVRRA